MSQSLTIEQMEKYVQWWTVFQMINVSNSFGTMGHDGKSGREFYNPYVIGMDIEDAPFPEDRVFATLLEHNFYFVNLRLPFEMLSYIIEEMSWYSFTEQESKRFCEYLGTCSYSVYLVIMSSWEKFDLVSALAMVDYSKRKDEIIRDITEQLEIIGVDAEYIDYFRILL